MKRLSKLVVFMLIVAGLVGSQSLAFAQGKTEITFWHAMSGLPGTIVDELVAEFNAANPDIHVEAVFQGRYGDLETKIMASVAASQPPVLAQVYENFTDNLLINNAIVPLEDYLNLSEASYNDLIEVFRDMNIWDGKLWTVPFNKSNYVLYYNTDLVPTPPATLEEFVAIAKQVSAEGKGEIAGFGTQSSVELFDLFLHLYGGALLDNNGKVAFNSQAGKDAFALIQSMLADGSAVLVEGYESEPFGAGLLGMYIGSSAGYSHVAAAAEGKTNWSTAPIFMGKQGAAPFMGTNVALFAKTTDKEKAAAARFVEFLTNTKNTAYWAAKTGYLPVRYSALEHSIWQDFLASEPRIANGPASEQQFANGFWQPRIASWSEGRSIIGKMTETVLFNQGTIEESLAAAEKEFTKVLERAGRR